MDATVAHKVGFRLVNAKVADLTPELARQFRDMPASPTERELNESRVAHLLMKAHAGLLVTFHWSLARVKGTTGTDGLYRMNAQHSSTMLSGINGHFPQGLKVHIDEYEVDTIEDLASLFSQFDDRKSARTPDDVAGAFQGVHPELKGIKRQVAKIAAEGICWYRQHIVGEPAVTGDARYAIFNEKRLYPFFKFLDDQVLSPKTPELRRLPIVGAIYGTFTDGNERAAREFWPQVAMGSIEPSDERSSDDDLSPAQVLDVWLTDVYQNKDTNLRPLNYYQACVYAWNAERAGREIKDVKYDTKKKLLTISE